MKNHTIIFSALMLASSAVLAQQSLLNAGQAVAPAPSMTDQLENAAEQKLLQAAPAPIQQGVQKLQQAQQLQNAVGAISGSPAPGTAVNPANPSSASSGVAASPATSVAAPVNPGLTSGKVVKEHVKHKGAQKLAPESAKPTSSSSDAAGSTGTAAVTSPTAAAPVASPSSTVVDTIEGAVKQKAAAGAMNLLK